MHTGNGKIYLFPDQLLEKMDNSLQQVFDGRFSSERRGINPQHYVNFNANFWVELVTCNRTEDEWRVLILCHARIVHLNSVNPAQQRWVVTLIHYQNKVRLSRAPIYPSILLWVWVGLPHTDNTHTHTHVELPTTVLIVKMVFQSSGEIKGEKERGARVGGSGGLNVILNDLRFTASNVLACFLSAGTERKQSASVKQEH